MTGPEIMAVGGFFVLLFGFLFGIWKYVDAKISAAKMEASGAASAASAMASLAREELAAHRLHVAETCVRKSGLREQTEQIMGAIGAVKDTVDKMTLRVDRIVENNQSRARRGALELTRLPIRGRVLFACEGSAPRQRQVDGSPFDLQHLAACF